MSASMCSAAISETEVLGDGEAEEHPPTLGHVGDSEAGPGSGRLSTDVVPVDADHARHRTHEARDRSQGRRLAGTVGAEQGDHLSGTDVQVEVAHDGRGVVPRREAVELEDRVSDHHPALSTPQRRWASVSPSARL